jgi:hypothetical protein
MKNKDLSGILMFREIYVHYVNEIIPKWLLGLLVAGG